MKEILKFPNIISDKFAGSKPITRIMAAELCLLVIVFSIFFKATINSAKEQRKDSFKRGKEISELMISDTSTLKSEIDKEE